MNARKLTLIALALVLLVPGALLARGTGGLLKELLPPRGYLQLTEEQKDAARALAEDLRATLEPLREQREDLAQQLRDALDSDTPDATEVGQLVIDQRDLGQQIRDEMATFGEAFRAELDADQQVKWDNFLQLRRLTRRQSDR